MKKILRIIFAMVIVVCMAFVVACSGSQTPENPTTYTLTFNMGGNGVQVESQTIEETQLPQKPVDPSAQGYVFGGWYTDSACENQFDFSAAINANTTVYAKWIQLTEDGKYMIIPTINGKNPGQVYADFVSSIEENIDNFSIALDLNGECKVTAEGTSVTLTMSMVNEAKKAEEAIYSKSSSDLGVWGGKNIVEITFVDGMLYYYVENSQGPVKMKTPMTWESFISGMGADLENTGFETYYDFGDYSFDGHNFFVDAIQDENNELTFFEMNLTGEDLDAITQAMIGTMDSFENVVVNSSVVKYTVALTSDLKLDHMNICIEIDVSAEMDGQAIGLVLDFDGDLRITNLGTTVINAPLDADSYIQR